MDRDSVKKASHVATGRCRRMPGSSGGRSPWKARGSRETAPRRCESGWIARS